MQTDQHRPPYVSFERRPVEDRNESIAKGYYCTKEVDFIIIVPYGSEGKTQIEEVYAEWLAKIKTQTGGRGGADGVYEVNSRFEDDWVRRIQNMYEAWRKGEDLEVEGFPLKNWPPIPPGLTKTCHELHVFSVEQLANAADDLAEQLGMGGKMWRERARQWLAAQQDGGAKVISQLAAVKAEADAKEERIKSLEAQIATLQQQVLAQAPKAK
jgi:polyhydroxyalkanoate synthesis regulator phasin